MKNSKTAILLVAVLVIAGLAARADQPKPGTGEREMKGSVVSFTTTSLVLSHSVRGKKAETTFVLTPETQQVGTLAAGASAEVHYRMENKERVAVKVEVREAAAAPAPKKK